MPQGPASAHYLGGWVALFLLDGSDLRPSVVDAYCCVRGTATPAATGSPWGSSAESRLRKQKSHRVGGLEGLHPAINPGGQSTKPDWT